MAINRWDVQPSAFADVVEEELGQLRTRIAADVHKGIVLATPVDTGRARGSWAISYTAPVPQDMISRSGAEVISRGYRQLAAKANKPFEKVVISSSLPYIGKLESGTSRQAPAGMVAVTMAGINATYR